MPYGLIPAALFLLLVGAAILLGRLLPGGAKHDSAQGQTAMRFGPTLQGLIVTIALARVILLFFLGILMSDKPETPVVLAVVAVIVAFPCILLMMWVFRT